MSILRGVYYSSRPEARYLFVYREPSINSAPMFRG